MFCNSVLAVSQIWQPAVIFTAHFDLGLVDLCDPGLGLCKALWVKVTFQISTHATLVTD